MKILTTATPIALAAALAATLAACGSSSPPTVTVTTTPSTSSSATAAASASTTSSSSSTTSSTASTGASSTSTTTSPTASQTTSTTTSSTTTTRTETGPAFVGTNPSSGTAIGHDLAAAIAVLARDGYTPVATSTYDAADTLRVLIGRRPGTTGERAFFFDQTIYLGTDASTPSAQITLRSHNDTEATLVYGLYQPGATAPSAERAVRFALDMGQLSALDPLPGLAQRR